MDDKGRVKLPTKFQEYFNAQPERTLFVTSLDRRIAQIYSIGLWKENEKLFATFRTDPKAARNIAFNAADLGAEVEMDSQGRVLFSTELRRELGIENAPVRLLWYRGHVEVLSEKIYEERKQQATQNVEEDLSKLEAAGLN